MSPLVSVWWPRWLRDESCGEHELATGECLSAAAEFPRLAPGEAEPGLVWGVRSSGPACRAKKGL